MCCSFPASGGGGRGSALPTPPHTPVYLSLFLGGGSHLALMKNKPPRHVSNYPALTGPRFHRRELRGRRGERAPLPAPEVELAAPSPGAG